MKSQGTFFVAAGEYCPSSDPIFHHEEVLYAVGAYCPYPAGPYCPSPPVEPEYFGDFHDTGFPIA